MSSMRSAADDSLRVQSLPGPREQVAGNEIAADMLKRIHTRASQLRVVSLSSSERAKQSIRELREFLDALEARDEELAYRLCVAHIEAAAAAALKSIVSVAAG